ncbi:MULTISPECIES: hypothetical protein [Methylomonas]|uniref:Uncharacterized protein n=1 Tax=Methylomonas denitrificans TaxID=1538553 RepID=A0A126T5R3_9GAMM|nr:MULTISPECIES: hypothetical protein [Methylomonas]AMK77431.1 hypothetical protein JT25_013230 [Methylomonas denitrificans]OAI05022.1 hypothetical protein A1342_11395 [Methylomonas methanica]
MIYVAGFGITAWTTCIKAREYLILFQGRSYLIALTVEPHLDANKSAANLTDNARSYVTNHPIRTAIVDMPAQTSTGKCRQNCYPIDIKTKNTDKPVILNLDQNLLRDLKRLHKPYPALSITGDL